jgi:hypothetical protein
LNVTAALVVMLAPVLLQMWYVNAPEPGVSMMYSTPAAGAPHPVTPLVSVVAVHLRDMEEVSPVIVTEVPELPAAGAQLFAPTVVLLETVTVTGAT